MNPNPIKQPTPEEFAAATLWKFIQQQRTDGSRRRTFRRAQLYGVFRGDVLVHWGYGPNAKAWARRTAANCWNEELRFQHMGIH